MTRAESPKEVALRFIDRIDRGDVGHALDMMDGDSPVDIVPLGLRGTGAVEGRAFLEQLRRAFPDLLRVRSAMEAGDVVVLEVTMEGTQATDFLGIVNQEKHVDVDQAWMVWVREGRVRGLRAYWCQNQLYRRLAVKRLDRVSILELAR